MALTCFPWHSGVQDQTLARADEDATASAAASYDVDGSGMVGPADVLALIDRIHQGDSSAAYDLDSSGAVDEKDVDALVALLRSGNRRQTRPVHDVAETVPPRALAVDPQVIVTLTPPGPPPYAPGSQIPVGVYVRRAQVGAPILIRLLQFDSQDTHALLTLELPVTHTDSTAMYAPFWFYDFTSTALCAADPTKCGKGYSDFVQSAKFSVVWLESSADALRQLTLPGDASPIYVGSVLVTLPANPGLYRLDLMNADALPPNSGALLVYGFGTTPGDPRVDLSAYDGSIAGGQIDLVVDMCLVDADCADDGNDCTQDICDAGTCRHPPLAMGAPCGNQTPQGDCDLGDVCDGAGACMPNYASNTTICRAAVNECDAPEHCAGDSADCPPNQTVSSGIPCADDSDSCTTDACDGAGICAHTNNGLCGACCVAGGDCMNNVLPEQCPDAATRFHSGLDCAAISCGVIPTVSEWGLVILTLCLLTGAKIVFVPRSKKTTSS